MHPRTLNISWVSDHQLSEADEGEKWDDLSLRCVPSCPTCTVHSDGVTLWGGVRAALPAAATMHALQGRHKDFFF